MPVVFVIALSACLAHFAPPGLQRQPDLLHTRSLRFWDVRGAPISVLVYSLVTRDRPDLYNGPTLTATFTLRHWSAGPDARDTAWQQGFNRSGGRTRDHMSTGLVTMPLAAGLTSWSLRGVSSWSGAPSVDSVHALQSFAPDPITVSDLALGVARTSETWAYPEHAALIDLMNVFARTDSVQLFFQVRSDSYHENVRTWITVTNETDPGNGQRVVQLNYPIRLGAGVTAFDHTLGIAKQIPGKYVVELQVGDLNGGGTSVRRGEFVIR